jgi:hypothetical protein
LLQRSDDQRPEHGTQAGARHELTEAAGTHPKKITGEYRHQRIDIGKKKQVDQRRNDNQGEKGEFVNSSTSQAPTTVSIHRPTHAHSPETQSKRN